MLDDNKDMASLAHEWLYCTYIATAPDLEVIHNGWETYESPIGDNTAVAIEFSLVYTI